MARSPYAGQRANITGLAGNRQKTKLFFGRYGANAGLPADFCGRGWKLGFGRQAALWKSLPGLAFGLIRAALSFSMGTASSTKFAFVGTLAARLKSAGVPRRPTAVPSVASSTGDVAAVLAA